MRAYNRVAGGFVPGLRTTGHRRVWLLTALLGLALGGLLNALPAGRPPSSAAARPAAPVNGVAPLAASSALGPAYTQAATRYGVPRDLLIALAYTASHGQAQPGVPSAQWGYGVMRLTVPPGGDSLRRAARLLGMPAATLESDDTANIRGAAALLHELAAHRGGAALPSATDPEPWYSVVQEYSGMSDARIARSYADSVFALLGRGLNAPGTAGEPLIIPAYPTLALSGGRARPVLIPDSADYGPAFWVPAYSGNYTVGRQGNSLNRIIIHDTEGSYQSAINWFQNPASGVSAHYVIRSVDGEITQMVQNADTAYHAGNWGYNLQAIGIEHEGYAAQQGWYTEAMYTASSALVRTMADRFGIHKDHAHIIGHYQVPNQPPPPHTDPGPNWDWASYLSKVRRDWSAAARVDNTDPGFIALPPVPGTGWQVFPGVGYNGSNAYMAVSTSGPVTDTGAWRATLPYAGAYDLYAYIPYVNNGNPETTSAQYQVGTITSTVPITLDQLALTTAGHLQNGTNQGEWGHVGTFSLTTSPAVTLTNRTSDNGKNVWFDTLMWIPVDGSLPPCGGGNYTATTATGAAIVPGTADIGNHCDECTTAITLPFTYTLYEQPFTSATLGSNGTLGFISNTNVYTNACLPNAAFSYAALPYWDDLRTDGTGGGIFTATTGSAPNRVFNIEWRACIYATSGCGAPVNFEVRLYENQSRVDFVYGTVSDGGNSATVGVERDTGSRSSTFACNTGGLASGVLLTYALAGCAGTPTPAPPTPTPTQAATSTTVPTGTPPPSGTPTSTPVGTPTGSPTSAPTTAETAPPTGTPTATAPTATPPATPPTTPLATLTTPAPTNTATPPACTLIFHDVLGDNPFYGPILCVACAQLAAGYDCGAPGNPCPGRYFRPAAGVTRGQTAKLVANSAGFAEVIPPGQQTFADVAPTQAFWLFVERAALHGVISGYGCGGPGEPCDPAHRPYFRPATGVTRGQLAKLLSNARGWTDAIPPGQQTFHDVPSGQPFWLYVERLLRHAAISGYADGTFRPANSATRGQTAKIDEGVFQPACAVPPPPSLVATSDVIQLGTSFITTHLHLGPEAVGGATLQATWVFLAYPHVGTPPPGPVTETCSAVTDGTGTATCSVVDPDCDASAEVSITLTTADGHQMSLHAHRDSCGGR